MNRPRFRLTPKKYTGETTIVSMRIPKDMLKDIDQTAADTGRNRNELIMLSLEFALKHIEIVKEESTEE